MKFFILVTMICSAPQSAISGQLRTLEVNLSFDASAVEGKTLSGYNLYEDSRLVCETNIPATPIFSCTFVTENGLHAYTLTARYSDGTESAKSPSFDFTISDFVDINATSQLRTLDIALTFDSTATSGKTLTGYRLYEDSRLVCETNDSSVTNISCSFMTIDGTHSYELAAYFTDGTESSKSPPFEFTIGESNQLTSIELAIPTTLQILDGKTLTGYKLYVDSELICQTSDPAATTISCLSSITDGTHVYAVSPYYTDGTEGEASSPIQFTVGDTSQLRTLQIALTFDSTAIKEKTLAGYRLYEDSRMVCETGDPSVTNISCNFMTTDGAHSYELAAYFTDGTESPKSPAFEFIIGESNLMNSIELAIPTDLQILDGKTLAGYKLYVDSELICQVSDPAATTISCLSAITDGTHIYTVSSYYTDGTEGQASSPIQFTVGDTSQLRTIDVALSFDPSTSGKTLAGYKLYEDSFPVCITHDPAATTITCSFITVNGTHSYELAAYYTDGTDSPKSAPFIFSIGDTPSTPGDTTETLAAKFAATPLSGAAPLTVSFDAAQSTGTIVSYRWDFGDGDIGSGTTSSHIYSIPGKYTASIHVYDPTGKASTASIEIQVDEATAQPTPPTATISSSKAAGESPLTIEFDGSSSTSTNSTIISYAWDFGDGSNSSGQTASHIYTIAGTYTTELLVTDALGLTDTETTPIIVTPPTTINQAPGAAFTATPTQGSVPVTVNFDGSSSQDPDGTITSYAWNFGDGTTGSGKTVQHIYTTPATYTATLHVTDDRGTSSTVASKNIVAEEAKAKITLYYEIGELDITSNWVRVNFENSFTNPAVFVSPPTNIDKEATLVRIRNLDKTGFEIRLQEWDYLDGKHLQETVSFIALEQGQNALVDGTLIEVGSFNGMTRKQTISFKSSFPTPPVVLTAIVSENETDAVTGRVSNVTNTNFAYLLQEQESSKNKHVAESVAYLAWSRGSGSVDNIYFSAALPTIPVTDKLTTIPFTYAFQGLPFLFAESQTMNDSDPGTLRIQNINTENFGIFFQEEQSKTSDTSHSGESVGYLSISPAISDTAGQ